MFERAVRAWGKLVEASPTSEGFRHDWAYLSDVVTTIKLSQSNDPKVLADVLAGALQTREIWQKWPPSIPRNRIIGRPLFSGTRPWPQFISVKWTHRQPRSPCRRAEALGQALVNDFPAIPQFRDHLARVYNYRWGLHYLAKNVPAEVESLRKWLVVLSKMVADFPTVPAYRTSLEGRENNVARWPASMSIPISRSAQRICWLSSIFTPRSSRMAPQSSLPAEGFPSGETNSLTMGQSVFPLSRLTWTEAGWN